MSRSHQIKVIMTSNVVCANPSHKFSQVIQLFTNFPIHHLPVVDADNKLIGIISSNDIMKLFIEGKYKDQSLDINALDNVVSIAEIMTPNPECVKETDLVEYASRVFRGRSFQALPVVNDLNELVGIVSIKDVLDWYADVFREL